MIKIILRKKTIQLQQKQFPYSFPHLIFQVPIHQVP